MLTARPKRRPSRAAWWRRARRLSQAAFLLLFFYLVLWTRQGADGLAAYSLFFRLDPLAGLAAILAGRRWIAGMALGLLTLGLTLVAGRAWCGWVCPLGTLLDLMPSRRARASQRDLGQVWRSLKYGVLALIVIGGLAGSITLVVLDPISLLTRAIASFILPLGDDLIHAVEMALMEVEPLQDAVIAFDGWLRGSLLPAQPDFVAANTVVGVLLVLVLAANLIRKRFWCRYLCPLGGLLGLISRVSLFRHRLDRDACVECGRCATVCPTGAISAENAYRADSAECIACMACLTACPTGAVAFPSQAISAAPMPYDPSRRQVLTMLGVTVAGVGLLRVARALKVPDRWLMRPPGATEASLSQCVRCGECLKVCPTGGLQPSLTTAGAEGLWTPVLNTRVGYCNYGCNSCGQVCPTGAIPNLELDVKREMVMGLAVVDRDRCLAWAEDTQCIVCEELCPVPEKAIQVDTITVTDDQGYELLIHRPVVMEGLCIGCGTCEWHCPVEGQAAIRVQYSPLAGRPRDIGPAAQSNTVASAAPEPTETVAQTAVPAATATAAVVRASALDPGEPADFVLIKGGTFEMGSPESEPWRGDDETQHTVSISDFSMCTHEVTQQEYQEIMGSNPSTFSGRDLPVENITWFDAIAYCNARSVEEGRTPVYVIDGQEVTWNRGANGYRLPTEAEWEYACRAGTTTPFNTETSIGADEADYYGLYPYEIENNYFSPGNLATQPGQYRQSTVPVASFAPNDWGLYDMHGNVAEWCWDYYAAYAMEAQTDPTGPASGSLRVNRGGGWNDFAKHLRSAYRASTPANNASFNLGLRLALGATGAPDKVTNAAGLTAAASASGNTLIVYFSWSGNTRGIAHTIQEMTGADIFELELVSPYSTDYSTVLEQAQQDQNRQARPELASHVEDIGQYDTIILGHPNWWASIPMPVASFLEEYDLAGKRILPFCSHGGGRFGQSLTAIAKLVPEATLTEGLSVHYAGGPSLPDEIAAWLNQNGVSGQ